MKKRNIIGVVIALIVVMFGVTGAFWYKNNVYIGISDVKAKNPEHSTCPNVAPGGLDIESAGTYKWSISGATVPYDVRIYLVHNSLADQVVEEAETARKENKEVMDMNDWAANSGGKIQLLDTINLKGDQTIDTRKYQENGNPEYKIVLDVHLTETVGEGENQKNYWCGRRHSADINRFGTEKNTNSDICNQWLNGEKFTYTSEDGKEYKLNEKIDEYISAGKEQEFRNFKSQKIGGACSDGGDSGQREETIKLFRRIESTFATYLETNEKSNVGSNADIGNPDDYEDRTSLGQAGTTIETLYCKTNSVYLKDAEGADGKDELEKSGTNQYALKYADREKRVIDNSDGIARANLYLFKYSVSHTETYDIYTNGEVTGHEDACKVDCTEYVKINFDPPQEVTAGMCFGYSVQVIAYTECKVDTTLSSGPQAPQASSFRVTCDHGAGYTGSIGAGPNEDFDQCILECDGGKYTDDCSTKCFDKVYGNDESTKDSVVEEDVNDNKEISDKKENDYTVKRLDYLNGRIKATFMADVNDNEQCPSVGSDPATVRNFFLKHPSGEIKETSPGNYTFESNYPGCYWAQYAPFYYTDDWGWETVVSHDMHWTTGTGCSDGSKCEPQAPSCTTGPEGCASGKGGQNGGGGFLVDVSNAGQGTCSLTSESPQCDPACQATCKYVSDDGANAVTAAQAYADFDASEESYQQALDRCNASATCRSSETPTTSTFYITVDESEEVSDYKWNESNSTNDTKYPTTPDSGSSSNGCQDTQSGGNYHIIEGRNSTSDKLEPGTGGLCYCGNTEYGGWHHYTRWTFPGSWINVKNNKVITEEPSENEKDFYEGGYNQYCVPTTAEDTNEEWHQEYLNLRYNGQCVGLKRDDVKARQLITTEDVQYNIHAKAIHFGNYDWNFTASCFYSSHATTDELELSDDGTPEETDIKCDEETDDPKPASEFRTKTVDLANVLPNGKGEADKLITFNWSDSGTKLDIGDYEIVPAAYKDYVETLGDKVFDDEYIDYEFTLTGNDMREIASHNVKYGDFSSSRSTVPIYGCESSGDDSQNYCLRTIRSSLISSLISQNSSNKRPSESQLKCNNIDSKGTGCQKFSEYESAYVKWMRQNRDCGLTGTCQDFS